MNILLDTTIQINRLFKPKDREIIKHIIDHNDCYCSTYVLGEFKANIVRDFVTLHSIMQIEENLTEVYQRIAEVYSARQKTRLLYIVNDLARLYDEDFDLIKEHLEIYPKKLLRRFYYGVNKKVLDKTKCARANAVLEFEDGAVRLKGISCNKRNTQCEIKNFWEWK